jgi:hypothetical protein
MGILLLRTFIFTEVDLLTGHFDYLVLVSEAQALKYPKKMKPRLLRSPSFLYIISSRLQETNFVETSAIAKPSATDDTRNYRS